MSHFNSLRDQSDVVCLSHLRWNHVFQRPQHLMSRFARTRRVFYVEEPVPTDGAARMTVEETPEGVRVVVPELPASLAPEAACQLLRGLLDRMLAPHVTDPTIAAATYRSRLPRAN